MASDTDICNLALAALGDEATVVTINPPEGSAQADHCAQWFPVAMAELLDAHDWTFSTRRAPGELLAQSTTEWAYTYAKPNGSSRIWAVSPADSTDAETSQRPYQLETLADGTEVILTNEPQAIIKYTVRTVDTARLSALATQALVRLLASYLAGPVLKNEAGRNEAKAQLQLYAVWLTKAQVSDLNQRHRDTSHVAQQIAARGVLPSGVRR